MNAQDFIRSIISTLDNIGSDEQPSTDQTQSDEPKQDGGIETVEIPSMAKLTPVKVDNKASTDGTAVKGLFPAPDHDKSEVEIEANDNKPDELDQIKRSAGISPSPQE